MTAKFLDMRITPRQCGGWIAIFDNGSMRFGVTADSEQAAQEALKEAEANWRRLASLPFASASSSTETDSASSA